MKKFMNPFVATSLTFGLAVLTIAGCGPKQERQKQIAERAPEAKTGPIDEKIDAEMPDGNDPSVFLLDTTAATGSPFSPASISAKTGWKHIKEEVTDYAIVGDAVMQNNRLVVVIRKGADAVAVYALTPRGPEYRTMLSAKGGGRIGLIKIIENSTASVRLDVSFVGAKEMITAGIRLVQNDSGVEVYAGEGMTVLNVRAKMRVAVVPNYFVDDMVFTTESLGADKILLPMEQFFLCPLEGSQSIMMCLCESDRVDAAILFDGSGKDRELVGAEIQVVPEKKTVIAFLESAGNSFTQAASAGAWTPPFPARWRVNLIKDGGFAESKAYKPELLASLAGQALVIYPLERDLDTPLPEFCMRDIMKAVLGVGPCEYVIQANQLVNDATPHQVAVYITQQFEKEKDVANGEEIKKQLDLMVEHVVSAQKKIDRYGQLGETANRLLSAPDAATAAAGVYVKGMKVSALFMEKTVNLTGRSVMRVDLAKQASDKMLSLIGKENGLSEVKKVALEMSTLNEVQDRELSSCRMAALWLKQQSRMMAEHSPDTKPLADQIVQMINGVMNVSAAAAQAECAPATGGCGSCRSWEK